MFFRDGQVIGLSQVFRSPRIPLAISVEKRVLEIAGLESRSGLIMGDFGASADSRRKNGLVIWDERGRVHVS